LANLFKKKLLQEIESQFGKLKKLPRSLSLYDLSDAARIYIRYSKVHNGNHSFYGLRAEDLKHLEGLNSFLCFLWDKQKEPLFIPFAEFEDVFKELTPANDGQFKVHIFLGQEQTELYISNAGRFNIEGFFGWNFFKENLETKNLDNIPDFSHSQIQTLIGSIGKTKGFDIWIPKVDQNKLDWNLTSKFECINHLQARFENINHIIKEIDIIWIKRGTNNPQAMFEVEHSTPIYSGLLRFNDFYLIETNQKPRFNIVSNDIRRSLFLKQINRPTFKSSGLSELCNFLEYKNVYEWYNRVSGISK